MLKKLVLTLTVGALATLAVTAFADELDNAPAGIPQGLIVRDDGHGNREVFKTNVLKVTDQASAEAAIAASVTAGNQIATIQNVSELDETTSVGAWYSVRPHYSGGFGGGYPHYAGGYGAGYAPYYAYPYYAAAASAYAYNTAYYYPYYTAAATGNPYAYTYYGYNPYCLSYYYCQ